MFAYALYAFASAARTTYSWLPYDRNEDATWKVSKLSSFGLPNVLINSTSEDMFARSFTGPQRNVPAIPPSVVDTAGTTVVKSISLTFTPGLT